jgi:integrase
MPNDRSPAQQPFPYLTREEVERFFQAIPLSQVRDRALFDLIYRHGLRRREAAQLTLEDVREGKIWISRVKRGVFIPAASSSSALTLPRGYRTALRISFERAVDQTRRSREPRLTASFMHTLPRPVFRRAVATSTCFGTRSERT